MKGRHLYNCTPYDCIKCKRRTTNKTFMGIKTDKGMICPHDALEMMGCGELQVEGQKQKILDYKEDPIFKQRIARQKSQSSDNPYRSNTLKHQDKYGPKKKVYLPNDQKTITEEKT